MKRVSDKITMREMLNLLLEGSNKLQKQIFKLEDRIQAFEERIDHLEEKMDKRFDDIESRMVEKNEFSYLVKILERREVISKAEAAEITIQL